MFAQLLKPRVQVANVRRGSGDAFTVQFQHHTEGGVGGQVLGTPVEHPPFGGVFPVIQIRGVFDVDVELSCGA